MANELKNKIVSKSIENLYLDAELSDVSFVFKISGESKEVTAHKLILSVASPVFYKIFYGLKTDYRYIDISNATIDGFKEFLQFFYLKRVKISMEHIEEVMHLAKKYRMFECINSCVHCIERDLTLENVCWAYQLAIVLNNKRLRQFCEKMISTLSLEIFQTDSFLRCDHSILKSILQIDLLLCKETDVLNACLSWSQNACKRANIDATNTKNVKSQLGECFYLIRFDAMNIEEFIEILATNREIFTSSDLSDISFMLNPNPRSRTLNWWTRNQELMCWRENQVEDLPYLIENVESIWFTTDKPLLLGALWNKGLLHRYSSRISVDFRLSIVEINSKSFENVILFTKMVTLIKKIRTRISIMQPLIICPQKLYEIRMETENCNGYYHCALWEPEVKLDHDIIVKFHQNFSINHSKRRGLISCLSFKRI